MSSPDQISRSAYAALAYIRGVVGASYDPSSNSVRVFVESHLVEIPPSVLGYRTIRVVTGSFGLQR